MQAAANTTTTNADALVFRYETDATMAAQGGRTAAFRACMACKASHKKCEPQLDRPCKRCELKNKVCEQQDA
ncbi:hypothetical protein SCHPADRAFT_943109 [Schizopora paradoxa]|uniref:Zn(2)-C6 fungal-type domain-containing protein n=1 Tax=Schizopora paradoxa TaxID=27342 RepID=A0A0H2REB5_9AGAM|nr:hypothetical protein SCHPADRAFT_943109 [Schizopora paradoxa]